MCYEDLESGLKLVNKLTSDHINLTSYSVMRVNLAAQVLSEAVGNVLNNFGPEEAEGTGQLCIIMDNFFDCLNVQNTKEHIIKRKLFLKPYESVDDIRFAWLDEFLQYFRSWKESTEARNDANYTENAKSKMFISWQSLQRVYKLLFYPSKKSVNFCYNKVSPILFQKGYVMAILKTILENNVLLVVDLIIQLYMILGIMTTQLRINF